MMCSTWKFSVFGILALMLAFGLVTSDAGATSDVNVEVTADGNVGLHAAEEGRTLTFELDLGADATAANQAGTIEIIPSGGGWTSPRLVATGTAGVAADLAADAAAGSVSFNFSAAGPTGAVRGGKLIANVPNEYAGTITWAYKTNVPVKAMTYKFRIRSTVHKDKGPNVIVARTGTGAEGDAFDYSTGNIQDSGLTDPDVLVDDAATYADNGHNIGIVVGAVLSGTGKFELTSSGIRKGADDYKVATDGTPSTDYNHVGKYFVTAEKDLTLVFTYTAAGTMHKGSVIRFDIPQDAIITDAAQDWPLLTDGSGAGMLTVSGATLYSFEEETSPQVTNQTAAAFLTGRVEKNHRVTFTYTTKTPKVTNESDDARIAATADNFGYVFSANARSLDGPDDDVSLVEANKPNITFADSDAVDDVTFIVVQGQGAGEVKVTPDTANADPADHGTNIVASKDDSPPANLRFEYVAGGRVLQGSRVTIKIPDGWTPAPRTSRVTGSSQNGIVSTANGTVTDTNFAVTVEKVENRLITLMVTAGNLASGENFFVIYSGVKQPSTGGISTFTAQSDSFKDEGLKALADGKSPSINVVVGDGSGTIALKRDGERFNRIAKATDVGDLEFVYTPAGYLRDGTTLQIEIPAGWTAPVQDNDNGTDDPGEVSISPSDLVTLALPSGTGPWTLTATTKVFPPDRDIVISYKKVKSPDATRSDTFNTRVEADGDATTTETLVSPSPTVGIDQAPDGAGIMTASVTQVNAGEVLDSIMFTYTAGGNMEFGARVQLKIDPDWPAAVEDDGTGKAGATTLTGAGNADLTFADDGRTLNADLTTAITEGAKLVFTYKNITVPSEEGDHTFTASSKNNSTGVLTELDEGSSPTINVRVRAEGTVMLATTEGPLPSRIEPNDPLGNLKFTFTAGTRMEIGSEVQIDIPAGWTRPSEDNNDPGIVDGEINLGADDPATVEVVINTDGSYTVTATTTGVLLNTEGLTIIYQKVAAPAEQSPPDGYHFASRMSVSAPSAGGTLLDIEGSPRVHVRTAPTMLTFTTADGMSEASFFVGGSVSLTVALDTRAPRGGLDVALTTEPAGMGTFHATEADAASGENAISMVTIDDSTTSMSKMVYYTSDMASPDPVTLTAKAGDLEDSVTVTVKSTIRDFQVNGMVEPIPVKGDATITVSAIGKKGTGTVKVTKEEPPDADGNVNVRTLVSLSLDSVAVDPADPDGDYMYSRQGGIPLNVDPADAIEGVHLDTGALDDGGYMVEVNIADEPRSIALTVLNDQEPPMLTDESATAVGRSTAINGGQVALSVMVTPNSSGIAIASVQADVSALDSTKEGKPVSLNDDDGDGTYSAIFSISADNKHAQQGILTAMVYFTATDEYGNVGGMDDSDPPMPNVGASITLRNDYDPPVLTVDMTDLGMARDGNPLMITVDGGESGLTVVANASSIGGSESEMLMEGTVEDEADANGNGMDADANGMGSDSNGANGMDADANGGNGMDANGMNGMDAEEEAPAGNGMYSTTVIVTGAMDGEQTITISATDAAGNESEAVTLTVTIDNTAPMLTGAMVDPKVANNGMDVTISVYSESGLTITADASAIGGGMMVPLMEAMMEASGGMDANGGNGANGMTNGNGANGMTNGMDANGMDANGADDPVMYSATVTVTGADEGEHMIEISTMDDAGNPATADATVTVQIDPIETDLMVAVDPAVAKKDSTIMVSATGQPGGGTATIMDSEGMEQVSAKALDPDGAPDMDGNQAYTRSIMLPDLADGTYTVTVEIQGETDSAAFEVLDDQGAPTLSDASAWPAVVQDGGQVALRVRVAMNTSNVLIDSVTADVSDLDVTRTEPVQLSVLASEPPGTYGGFHTISAGNMAAGAVDGEKTVTFMATDRLGTASEPKTATVTLKNDTIAPTLSMPSAMPASANDGTVITISVNGGESGLTVTADASAIGGGMVTLMEGMMAADDAANGMDANGMDANGNGANGNGMDANGMTNGNGNGANGMTNGMDANGMDANGDNGMMAAGNGMYTGMATVTGAEDGAQMITITATDGSDNSSSVSVSVMIDNTAATLSDAAVTPDWALNGDTVTISVNGGESGLTVTADASAIGGMADEALAESADTAGMYSADVMVTGAMGGDQMVSISASDALGNMSDMVSASVSIHVVTSASFSPAEVSTGDMVMVSAMGTAGLTATFSVFDAEGTMIVTDGSLMEDADTAGSYAGSFEVVIDAHPTGTYWVSVDIGQASKTAEGALSISHAAEFDLMIGAGTHLIHVPLAVTHIDGMPGTIGTVRELYNALGDAVNIIITLGADGSWNSYLGDDAPGASYGDTMLGDSTGLVAVMNSAATLKLAGDALGTGGVSTITLNAGNNLVGVPLDSAQIGMISDVLGAVVSAVVVSNEAGDGFQTITQAGDPGDGPLMGGRGYIVVAAADVSIPVIGSAWQNAMMDEGMPMAAPPADFGVKTPVLHVRGKLIDEAGMMSLDGLNVSISNLTSGVALGNTLATDEYSMTFVKLDDTAAKVGDVLEIKADSGNPLLGIRPVQHVVTAEDVLNNSISLPDLVTYEIPAQTELLANYPNPFNPETWIPFRLAADASVSLSIYGASGSLVRTIDVGFTPAAVYEGRSDAIYWDGRNNFGEQVSSGIYFYHLQAGEFSATRKMVVVK